MPALERDPNDPTPIPDPIELPDSDEESEGADALPDDNPDAIVDDLDPNAEEPDEIVPDEEETPT